LKKDYLGIKNQKNLNIFFIILGFLIFFVPSNAFTIERRQAQFKSDSSYLFLPAPYSVAGVGQGIAFIGQAANIYDSYIDITAIQATGDAEGYYLGLSGLHLISETLIFEYNRTEVSKVAFNNYSERGIDTEKNDFTILQFSQLDDNYSKLTLSLFERRAELFFEHLESKATAVKILDNEGNVQSEFDNPSAQSTEKTTMGFIFDYTDDFLDARKGVRVEVQRTNSPPTSEDESDFFVIDKELKIYIPIGDYNVWAFQAMFSDSDVTKLGVTDPNKIASGLGLSCSYDTCSQNEKDLIDRTIVEREKGTAATLGGYNLLRSYPLDRFQGAHMRYYSTEFRFNFANEVTPFDFWIWKDISTSLQWAFFYDWGTVAETQQDLWKKSVYSIGTGFRMVSASGYVYRADWATGKEGSNITMVFEYPW
jgi:hypothetical protein